MKNARSSSTTSSEQCQTLHDGKASSSDDSSLSNEVGDSKLTCEPEKKEEQFSFSKALSLILEDSSHGVNTVAAERLQGVQSSPCKAAEVASTSRTVTSGGASLKKVASGRLEPGPSHSGVPISSRSGGNKYFSAADSSSTYDDTTKQTMVGSTTRHTPNVIPKEEDGLGASTFADVNSKQAMLFQGSDCSLDNQVNLQGTVGSTGCEDCGLGDATIAALDESLTQKCERCGKLVCVWNTQEHEDYHLALDLSETFPAVTKPTKPDTNQHKRKLGKTSSKKTSKKKAPKKVKTLEDFFR